MHMNTIAGSIRSHLAAYKDCHEQDPIIICGCGHSLKQFKPEKGVVTIGVNDVGRQFSPDYLVVLNSASQFKAGRFQYVENTQAKAVFSQLNLGIKHNNIVRFNLGQRGGTEINDELAVPYTRNSPYVALCLAMYMGAKKIGLIGVDFTDHHFFADTGKHPLSKSLYRINQEYTRLRDVAAAKGIQIVNLGAESRLTAFPKMRMDEFLKKPVPRSPAPVAASIKALNIVSYATTPVAGVPEILARCINHYTPHSCCCVWQNNAYANGVSFGSAVEWNRKPGEAKRLLAAADVVIVHNGKVAREHKSLLANKAVVTMAHNYLWNVDQQFVARGLPGVVVGQYQATLPEFSGWTAVANPVPDWDQFHQPTPKNKTLTICYTPSGKHERYPHNHRLYWHSKGYASTMAILDRLATCFSLKLNVIRNKQLSHQQVLRMKQEAHIVIDECVTGSYHRNSLEGLACGCVVINGLDTKVARVFQQCAGGRVTGAPFVSCDLDTLEQTLIELIQLGSDELVHRGAENRRWLEQHWRFDGQWENQWQEVIGEAMKKFLSTKSSLKKIEVKSLQEIKVMSQSSIRQARPVSGKMQAGPLPVYWTCRNGRRGNFGDMLSPILTKALSGRPAVFKQMSPRLFAVGSLLKFAKTGDLIWGTGFIQENDRAQKGIDVRAVRGPLTREMLLQQGITCPEVYGDPALLLPVIYDKPVKKKYEIGLIPHYVDLPVLRKMLANRHKQHLCIIDIRAGVEEVIKMTRQCELVLSSSLHGIILAEAYGIPAAWVDISNKVVGEGFKFRDYYASTNRPAQRIDWRARPDLLAGVEAAYSMPVPKIDIQKLVAAFPLQTNTRFDGFILPERGNQYTAAAELKIFQQPKSLMADIGVDSISSASENKNEEVELVNSKRPAVFRKKMCIFGTATENYVEFLVASLRSFIKHNGHEEFDYFILGHNFNARTRRMMNRFGIRYMNINLNEAFTRNFRHRYPGECFWIFKGPELFHEMGYQYSLAVDGDILCCRKLELDWLPELKHIAGVHRGCSNGEFLKNINQLDALKRKLNLQESHASGPATNSGVLFFNNARLTQAGFFKRAVDTFRRSENAGIPRAGDDSTLALIFALNPQLQLRVLPDAWNVYRGLSGERGTEELIETANILHLSAMKPWQHHRDWPNKTIKLLVEEWRKFWPNSKVQRRMHLRTRTLENELSLTASRSSSSARGHSSVLPVELYWYRGSVMNVGDEIAPYLVPKILNLDPKVVPAKPVSDPRKLPRDVLISVGSVLRLCAKNSLVWGAGIRNIDQDVARAKQFCAVRGPLTQRRLLQLGYTCPDIFGDPAILLPRYYQPKVAKKYRLGIVPHLVDYPQVQKLVAGNRDIKLVDVRTPKVEDVIDQIVSCETLLSSSLHGIILAVSYGIPVRWLKISDRIMGDDCKFYDFFASLEPDLLSDFDFTKVEITDKQQWWKYTPLSINNNTDIANLANEIVPIANPLDGDRLLAAFPFERFSNLELSA